MMSVRPPYLLLPALGRAMRRVLRGKTRTALLRLNDHQLADLGLSRSQAQGRRPMAGCGGPE